MIWSWIALGAAFTTTAVGQVIYKLFAQTRQFTHLVLAVLFFAMAPVCSYIALQSIGVGMVYIGTAITNLMVLGMSRYVLKEKITRDHGIAALLILAGLIFYVQ